MSARWLQVFLVGVVVLLAITPPSIQNCHSGGRRCLPPNTNSAETTETSSVDGWKHKQSVSAKPPPSGSNGHGHLETTETSADGWIHKQSVSAKPPPSGSKGQEHLETTETSANGWKHKEPESVVKPPKGHGPPTTQDEPPKTGHGIPENSHPNEEHTVVEGTRPWKKHPPSQN